MSEVKSSLLEDDVSIQSHLPSCNNSICLLGMFIKLKYSYLHQGFLAVSLEQKEFIMVPYRGVHAPLLVSGHHSMTAVRLSTKVSRFSTFITASRSCVQAICLYLYGPTLIDGEGREVSIYKNCFALLREFCGLCQLQPLAQLFPEASG